MKTHGDKCEQCEGGVVYYRVRYQWQRQANGDRVKVELERRAIPVGTSPMNYYTDQYTYPVWAVEAGECQCKVLARQHNQLIKSTTRDGVPTKYDKYFWSDFGDQPKAREIALEFVRGGLKSTLDGIERPGLLFMGPTGVHKSSLAYMIYRECLSLGIVGDWWLADKLVEAKQDTYDSDYSGDKETFNKACRVPLLVLDDLGTKRPSGAILEIKPDKQDIMFKLFEHREAKSLPLIATTNLKRGELYDHFGDRVASRILGLCHVVPMLGKDSRVEGEISNAE